MSGANYRVLATPDAMVSVIRRYPPFVDGNGRDDISTLIKNGFLADADVYHYDVGLTSLKIGINGDYTVKSSEALYTNSLMQSKL